MRLLLLRSGLDGLRRHVARGLTVPTEAEVVAALPGGAPRGADEVVGVVALLAEATGLAARRGKAAHLAVLVDRVAEPVDRGILPDRRVLDVDANDLVILVSAVLVDPVRVEDAEVASLPANALLGDGLEVALELELIDTLVL